ncbi:glycosyl transferase [Bacteroidales bacterium]|nr:glycosyl transferase [Bacteroidales bacterium]
MATKKEKPRVSMIISTYNRVDALSLCLQSIACQSLLPDELVIGDDGSRNDTLQMIQSFQKHFPIPIVHVWQEDKGFRLAMARNKSVAQCKYEYIIEIDGDLILDRRFVEDHVYFACEGYFIKGGRVNLTEELTKKLCSSLRLPDLNFLSKGLKRRINAFHCLSLSTYLSTRYKKNKIVGLGCNMSFWKKDYIAINGYDEFFEGWGGEDWDFACRMLNSGVKRFYLKFSGIVFHLWHQDFHMQNKDKNFEYYYEKKGAKASRCDKGIDQYLL